MRLADRLTSGLLRWDRLLLAALLGLPLVASSVLGLVWLAERGWLLWFILGSAGFYAVLQVSALLLRRAARRHPVHAGDGPVADPDWTEAETAAFERARARISARLVAPLPWADLPAEALATLESVAIDLSGGKRGVLDFTLPEALLLIDRVALRYRAFLLTHVPLSDRLSVRTMHWLWSRQETAALAWETGYLAWRGVRLFLNPAAALLREGERLLASGLQDRLSLGFRRDAQVVLLEEAAQAAVDLYSGRLTHAGAEPVQPGADIRDEPLQVLVVGQAGAGRSSLIGALADHDDAGTVAVAAMGGAIELTEAPGLDGTTARRDAVAAGIAGADLVLWVHRANRPGRAPDAELLATLTALRAKSPDRPAPPVLHIAVGVDLLIPGWPRPEHALDEADTSTIASITGAISATLGGVAVHALGAQLPFWNLGPVFSAIDAALPQARRIRHHRHRAGAAARGKAGVTRNLARTGRGAAAVLKRLVRRD